MTTMNTFSTQAGDRIVIATLDRPDGDISLRDRMTLHMDTGAVRVGTDTTGELISGSGRTTQFINEIRQNDLPFRIHVDPASGTRQRSVLVCHATGGTPTRVEWVGYR